MPVVFVPHQGQPLEAAQGPQFLADHGVLYEHWDVSSVDSSLREQWTLSAEEQAQLVAPFHPQLERLARDYGYVSHDVIVLNRQATPNLDTMLENFQREHHHSEDEVRFIVAGEGIFTLTRNGDTFDVLVTAGDLISVPAYTRHWFTLTDRLNVKAIRLFQTQGGWQAIYEA
jgi:1,2-dihydroxy-3-keto-5-methylthiopentene dioxygenase